MDTISSRYMSPPSVAFFHFSAMESIGTATPMEAFRALAIQLIQARRKHPGTLDALTMLFEKTYSGQQQASGDQAEAILRFLLQQAPAFIVMDGVDECCDNAILLTKLWELLDEFDCSIVMFGRPEIKFPAKYRTVPETSWKLRLTGEDNLDAIHLYLSETVTELACEGLFHPEFALSESTAHELTRRANGMFLWARLLCTYLRCPALSPLERHDILMHTNLIEGIGSLYNKILGTLGRGYEREVKVASDIFKWISAAAYPLNAADLRMALAISPGYRTSSASLLADYPNCISRITRSLVDLDPNGVVNFIHISLKEFLDHDPGCLPLFSLRDRPDIHSQLAAKCLSYLIYDLPPQPIGYTEEIPFKGVQQTMISSPYREADLLRRTTFNPARSESSSRFPNTGNDKFPLLKYTTLCWSVHLNRSLSSAQEAGGVVPIAYLPTGERMTPSQYAASRRMLPSKSAYSTTSSSSLGLSFGIQASHDLNLVETGVLEALNIRELPTEPFRTPSAGYQLSSSLAQLSVRWAPLLSAFLIRRPTVTAWVEACWAFMNTPSLEQSLAILRKRFPSDSMMTMESREMAWIISGMNQLSEALTGLEAEHHALLHSKPSMIWSSTIKAAEDRNFWPV